MRRVVSISLGSSKRNKESEIQLGGQTIHLERRGTDGDMVAFARLFSELDGKVDAFGIGGADLYLVSGEKRYTFHEIARAVRGAVKTPVVDGSGLKHTLERETIGFIQREGLLDFAQQRVLLMSAVDRYGMAQALSKLCPDVIYGDLLFGLGLNLPVRSYKTVERLAGLMLPVITRLPFKWFYPTGEKQDSRSPKFQKIFADRTVIAGDSLFILRYAPDLMPGVTVITQSVREANIKWFRQAGVRQIITTTPIVNGETFATNVMEAALVALLGKRPEEISEAEMMATLTSVGWKPNVIDLQS